MMNKKMKNGSSKLYEKRMNELAFLTEWISVSWTCVYYYIYYNCEILFGSLMKPN